MRPVVAAMSRTVRPSANQTAIWLSAGVRPRVATTRVGSIRGRVPRLGNQHQGGDTPAPKVHLRGHLRV